MTTVEVSLQERYESLLKKISQAQARSPSFCPAPDSSPSLVSLADPTSLVESYRNEAPRPILIAVSKGQSAERIEAIYQLGHRDFGENYTQELAGKVADLKKRGCDSIRWHFIGRLQTNKVKALLPQIAILHGLDSVKLAQEVSKRWMVIQSGVSASAHTLAKLPVFIQVNIDEETSKAGFLPNLLFEALPELAKLPGLSFQGLMCIPDENSDPRFAFRRLRELEKKCQPLTRGQLSMGMSQDFEVALEEGATHIRVGTLLFGPRTVKTTG